MLFFPEPISLPPYGISGKSSLFYPAGEKTERNSDSSTKSHIKAGFKSSAPWLGTTETRPAEKGEFYGMSMEVGSAG